MPDAVTLRFAAQTDLTLVVETRGTGPLTLVLVHGAMMSRRGWRAFTDALLARSDGLRIIAPDLPGFGDSSKPETGYDLPAQAATLAAFLRAVTGGAAPDARTVLIGHSMGGAIALHLALDHPGLIDGLVVMDSGLGKPQGGGTIGNFVPPGDIRAPGRDLLAAYMRNWLFAPESVDSEALIAEAMRMTAASFHGVRAGVAAHDLSDRIATFPPLPLLALRGTHDRTRTAGEMQAMAALTPDFAFAEIDAAGHCPQVERPAETAERVLHWLAAKRLRAAR